MSYCIVNFALFLTLQKKLTCETCQKHIKFSKCDEKGLGFQLVVKCQCKSETSIPSSPRINNSYEINRRFVFAMRLLGVGFQGIHNFCGMMDIGKGFTKDTYYNTVNHIWKAASTVCKLVFKKAVKEEQEKNEAAGYTKDRLSVSGDGSWAKRGFSSLIGIASLIGKFTGKVLDVIVKSSICKACEKWAGREHEDDYEAWYEEHKPKCNANHEGSAGMMEVNGIIEMFKRSVELYNVFYEYYIGDGDTKTFKSLIDVEPYGDVVSVKKKSAFYTLKNECINEQKMQKKSLHSSINRKNF